MQTATRNRSYENRPQTGAVATLLADHPYYDHHIPAGTVVHVLSVYNAGFRGIEAQVQVDQSETRFTVSTGLLK